MIKRSAARSVEMQVEYCENEKLMSGDDQANSSIHVLPSPHSQDART
jgi:hypothetical protein